MKFRTLFELKYIFILVLYMPVQVSAVPVEMNMENAIAYALKNSEEFHVQTLEKRRLESVLHSAWSVSFPQIESYMTYDRNWLLQSLVFNGASVKVGSEHNVTAAISVRQLLFSGGRISATREIARNQYENSELDVKSTREQIIANVESSYYDVLVARELKDVANLAVEISRKGLFQVRAMLNAGRASSFEELRAKGRLATTVADSIGAFNNLSLAVLTFKNVIGLDVKKELSVVGDLDRKSPWGEVELDSLISVAREKRFDIVSMQLQKRIHDQTIKLEQSARMPTLQFIAAGQSQMQNDKFSPNDSDWRKNWSTGIIIQMPIFDGFRTRNNIKQAKINRKKIEYHSKQLERSIQIQIESSYLLVKESDARIKAEAEAVLQAEKGLKMANSRYSTGAATQLEVMDAQLLLIRARTTLIIARRDQALGLVSLERAIGVLGDNRFRQ